MSQEVVEAKVVCDSCHGSGLYRSPGYLDPPGFGRLCSPCGGNGYRVITYIPFREKRRLPHMRLVCRNGDMPSDHDSHMISYENFLVGALP